MSNTHKDLVSDYFKQYPLFRYILPGLMLRGQNITDSVYMARQACWVLAQIYNDENQYRGRTTGVNGTLVSSGNTALPVNTLNNLSQADVELLAIFLQVSNAQFPANATNANALIRNRNDVAYNSAAGIASFSDLLKALVDNSGPEGAGLTAGKVAALNDLLGLNATNLAVAGTGAAATAAAVTFINGPTALGALNTFNPPSFNEPTLYNYDIATLATGGAGTNLLLDRDLFYGNPAPAVGTQFKAISVISGSVYMFAHAAQNSYIGAMSRHVRPANLLRYEFYQEPNGKFNLRTYDQNGQPVSQDFSNDFNKLVGTNDFCKAFGVQGALPTDVARCGQMIADCLGDVTADVGRCRANFKTIDDLSENLRGWNTLADDQKRYMAYRVLIGLGVNPSLDSKTGNYVFVDAQGNPIYTRDELFTFFGLAGTNLPPVGGAPAVPATAATSKHVSYIHKLMGLVGTLETKRRVGDSRPTIAVAASPSFITIRPALLSMGLGLPGLAMGGLRPVMPGGVMFGGADSNLISTIQYGAGNDAVSKIVDTIRAKLGVLSQGKSTITAEKRTYIEQKLGNMLSLSGEIDSMDNLLTNAIALANQHGTKDIVFTETDLANFKAQLEARQQKMATSLNKMDRLSLVLSRM